MDSSNCCSYVAEKSDPSNWHGETPEDWMLEEDSWSCKHKLLDHEIVENPDFCVFHTDPEDLPDDVDEGEAFVEVVNQEVNSDDEELVRKKTEFVGSTFGEFRIEEGTTINSKNDFNICFDHTIFGDEVDLEYIVFNSGISMRATKFSNSVSFNSSSFTNNAYEQFNNAKFTDDVSFDEVDFDSVSFNGSEFTGDSYVSFREATFSGEVWFDNVDFTTDNRVVFDDTEFNYDVWFTDTTFTGEVCFRAAKFHSDSRVWFEDAEFKSNKPVWFSGTEFLGRASFSRTKFLGDGNVSFAGVDFSGVQLSGNVSFIDTKFIGSGKVSFGNAIFNGDNNVDFSNAEFNCDVSFNSTEMTGDGTVSFEGVSFFGSSMSLKESDISKTINLRLDKNADQTSFAGSSFVNSNIIADSMRSFDFHEVDFTGVNLNDIDFSESNLEQTLFTRANLYDADFTGAKLDGAIFASARVNQETNFGEGSKLRVSYDPEYGKVNNGIRTRIRRAVQLYLPLPTRWSDPSSTVSNEDINRSTEDDEELGDTADQSSSDENEDSEVDRLRKAAGAYHTLERIGQENSLPDLQTTGFVRRQEMHHRRYRAEGQWGKWLRAAVARFTLLYGESPYRVAGFSFLIILVSGALYPLGGFQANNSGEILRASSISEWLTLLPDGIYFSTLTFTTLGFGDFQPVGMGRWLAVTETALGAMMIALLVFVLGRRAAR